MAIVSIDQLGREVVFQERPQRIVSLVPSITEMICDLGLADRLVGRTKFCIHPHEVVYQVAKIGGTKNPHIDQIRQLTPDLIIANKEENRKEDIEVLSKDCQVWVSDVKNIQDGYEMVRLISEIFGVTDKGMEINERSEQRLDTFRKGTSRKIAYLIWKGPYMSIGCDTYIHDVLQHLGYTNVFGDLTRYPIADIAKLKEAQPEEIWLSSEPFPFKEAHIKELSKDFPAIPIRLVDGEFFSWYGSRVLRTAPFLS